MTSHPLELEERVVALFVANRAFSAAGSGPELARLQTWFRRALENSQDALVMVDMEWRVTYVNQRGEEILGCTGDGLVGKYLWEELPHLKGSAIEIRCREAQRDETPAEFEASLPTRDVTLGVRAHPTFQGLAIFLRDITARRAAESALRESEERFRLIARATADALWDWDLRTNTLWWGDGIHKISGFSVDELAPDLSSWSDRIHPEDRDRVLDAIHRVIDTGGDEWEAYYRFQRREGSYAEVVDRGFVVRDEDGTARRMIGGMRDRTESLRAEERIRFQAHLLDAVAQAVIATDAEGLVTYWNPAAEALYGWHKAEVLGRSIIEVTPTTQSYEDSVGIMAAIRRGESWSGDFEVRRKDGSTFHAQVTDSPILDSNGEVIGVIGISSDATEQRELENRLRQSQKMEAVGRLAGGIAHDFNNVLTVILGRARLVLDDLAEASPHREDLDQIVLSAERAAALTSRLLAFGRNQVLQERIVDLGAAATEMQSLLGPLLPERIELRFEAPASPPLAKVDPTQLQQVLLNLAINARDAIDDCGTITLRAESLELGAEEVSEMPWDMSPGRYAALSVQDTGSGIPAEHLDQIFEPFFTTKPEGLGTGLGLSMVYGMMKQSRGFVTVESAVGEGTTFRLLFPQVESPPATELSAESPTPVGDQEAPGVSGPEFP
ncbi:MAG: PAS domain S-box protein [Gemmatimonadota bacterium]